MVNNSKIINLKTLNLDELSGIVSIYPWFTCARLELCRRMAELGEEVWDKSKFAQQALYCPSRKVVYTIMKNGKKSNRGINTPKPQKQVYVIGGDYFSSEQYASAKKDEDNIFSTFISKALEQKVETPSFQQTSDNTDFCTEELAKVYLEQGYSDKAKEIYSKLSLRMPEKSVYFADLIEKIDK